MTKEPATVEKRRPDRAARHRRRAHNMSRPRLSVPKKWLNPANQPGMIVDVVRAGQRQIGARMLSRSVRARCIGRSRGSIGSSAGFGTPPPKPVPTLHRSSSSLILGSREKFAISTSRLKQTRGHRSRARRFDQRKVTAGHRIDHERAEPGKAKTFSMITVPPMSEPMLSRARGRRDQRRAQHIAASTALSPRPRARAASTCSALSDSIMRRECTDQHGAETRRPSAPASQVQMKGKTRRGYRRPGTSKLQAEDLHEVMASQRRHRKAIIITNLTT